MYRIKIFNVANGALAGKNSQKVTIDHIKSLYS